MELFKLQKISILQEVVKLLVTFLGISKNAPNRCYLILRASNLFLAKRRRYPRNDNIEKCFWSLGFTYS